MNSRGANGSLNDNGLVIFLKQRILISFRGSTFQSSLPRSCWRWYQCHCPFMWAHTTSGSRNFLYSTEILILVSKSIILLIKALDKSLHTLRRSPSTPPASFVPIRALLLCRLASDRFLMKTGHPVFKYSIVFGIYIIWIKFRLGYPSDFSKDYRVLKYRMPRLHQKPVRSQMT